MTSPDERARWSRSDRLRQTRNPGRRIRFAIVATLLAAGCTAGGERSAFFHRLSAPDAAEAALSGEALAQRKASMRRIRRDLASFRRTLEQLARHGKTGGIARFERFAGPYLETRVDPLIEGAGAAGHPELRPFHAELLLSKALLLHQMGEFRAVRRSIARLEREFASLGSMLILYPTGEAVTLEQSVELLRRQTEKG